MTLATNPGPIESPTAPAIMDAGLDAYQWDDSSPESSHAYLDDVVIRTICEIRGDSEPRSLRVFDAGCGNGTLLDRLKHEGHEVAGCELSSDGVRLARQLLGPGVRVEKLSVYEPLVDTFGPLWDVVISTEVIEHLYAPRVFLRRVAALLAPGGSLIISTPYHGYLKNLALALAGAMDRHYTALWDGGHIKFWSYSTLTRLLSEIGFDSFRFYGAGRLPGLWKSMIVRSTWRSAT